MTCAALNRSADNPVPAATPPVRMNNGTTDSVYRDAVSNGACPSVASALDQPDNAALPTKPTSRERRPDRQAHQQEREQSQDAKKADEAGGHLPPHPWPADPG